METNNTNQLLNYYEQLNRDFCYYYETGVLGTPDLLELTYELFKKATAIKAAQMTEF